MKKYFFCIALLATLASCEDVLDKHDINGIDQVFTNEALSKAYLDKLYYDNLPAWTTSYSPISDEAPGGDAYMYGTLTIESVGDFGTTNFTKIRNINILLDEMEKSPLEEQIKAPIMAQAYFLRAWRYFELVKLYGGVPMVLVPQDPFSENVEVPRDKTSMCIEQIVSDLEKATILPAKWDDLNKGRITRGAAMALKGRVLLYYASPQFNPSNDVSRWEAAYQANKAALDTLVIDGHALHSNFAKLWFEETNKEAIFITRYNTSDFVNAWDKSTRPRSAGNSAGGSNQPTLEMVNAFPMKNGLPITDAASGYDPVLYWKDRDPRFTATIAYNGGAWPLNNLTTRKQWTFQNNKWEGSNNTKTGFYCKKAISETYGVDVVDKSGTDWIEIRLAEVMLNLAECANATNHIDEAYSLLTALRARAGIEAGADNLYGLKAGMTKDEMFEAIVVERQIELAFESKRYWDLRRWRMFGRLNTTVRHGLKVTLNGISADDFKTGIDNGSIVVTNDNYATYFTNETIVLDTKGPINFKDEYYFYGIPKTNLDKNPKLLQTEGWEGGTFNPLE